MPDSRVDRRRECGDCSLCCKAVAVVELKKPTGIWCRHICEHGCGIHDTRGDECRSFRCLWLNGHFEERDRPDRVAVVFFSEALKHGEAIVTACESYPGATGDSPRAKELLLSLLRAGETVVVRNYKKAGRVSPDGQVAVFKIDEQDPLRVAAGEAVLLREDYRQDG